MKKNIKYLTCTRNILIINAAFFIISEHFVDVIQFADS